jgi:hypothetical protein
MLKKPKKSGTLIGTIEKQYGVKFDVNPNMKLSTYLKKNKLPSMGRALEKIEKFINYEK